MVRSRVLRAGPSAILVLALTLLLVLAFPWPSVRGAPAAPAAGLGHAVSHASPPRSLARAAVNHPALTMPTSGTWTDLTSQLTSLPSGRAFSAMAYDPTLHEIVLFGGYDPSITAVGDTWVFNASGWTDITSSLSTAPSARWGPSLTWDENLSALVLFGGRGGAGFDSDTWTFNATGWHLITTTVAPSPRAFYQSFYDPTLQKLVLFGGTCLCGFSWVSYNDTWYFSGGSWTNVTSVLATAPPPTNDAYAAWDDVLGAGVMFAGSAVPATCTDFDTTWTFTGGWNQTSPSNNPGFLTGGFTAYDPNASQLVVYGGLASAGFGLCYNPTETWSYVGSNWVNITPFASGSGASPPGRCCGGMAFDPDLGAVIMFGGNFQWSGTYLSETWALIPPSAVGSINAVPTTGAAPLNVSFQSLVLGNVTSVSFNWSFGDGSPNGSGQNVSHVYLTAGTYTVNWTATDSLGGQYNASLTVTVVPGYGTISASPTLGPAPLNVSFFSNVTGGSPVVLYNWSFGDGSPNGSGQNVSHVYRTAGLYAVHWTATDSLAVRYNAALNISVSSNDRWNDLSVGLSTAPSIRSQTSMTYDPQWGGILLFGGYDPAVLADGDTWLFANGTWSDLTGGLTTSPPARWGDTMVWDPLGPYVVMFGGRDTANFYNDTWTFDASGWHPLVTPVAPSPRGWGATFFDPVNGQIVLFGGSCLSCGAIYGWEDYNDTWYLSGSTWTDVSSKFPVSPPVDDFSFVGWDPTANQAVVFGGQALAGSCATYSDTWTFATGWNLTSPTVHPPNLVGGGMAFDSIHQRLLLFGGLSDSANNCGDSSGLWAYSTGTWSDITNLIDNSGGAPYPRCCFAMAGDPVAGIVVLFGGGDQSGRYNNETWSFPAAPFTGSITATATAGIGPFNVSLSSSAAGGLGPYSFNWSFGDGSPNATTASVTHEFVTPGTYPVTWHATDSQNRSINRTLTIVVVQPIGASASASRVLGEAPMSVNFSAPITGGLAPFTYLWSFGDGGTSSARAPTHSYGSAGNYTATVTIHDSIGETAVAQVDLTAIAPLSISVTPIAPRGIVPFDVGFTASVSAGQGPYNLSWSFGDGSPNGGNVSSLTHTFAQLGTFTTTVTAVDGLGYSGLASVTVQVAGPLTAVPSVVPAQGISPLVISYDATISGGFPAYSQSWTFGDGTSATGSGFHTYTVTGQYDVVVNVSDSAGFTATATSVVDVVAPFSATTTASLLVGDAPLNVTFSAQPTGGAAPFTYAWGFGDGSQGSGASPWHRYVLPGHFHVALTATDGFGDTAFSALTVDVSPALGLLPLGVAPSTAVAGETNVTFTATPTGGSGAFTFVWSGLPGGCTAGNVSRFFCVPTQTGDFVARVGVNDTGGGHANATAPITVTASTGPVCPGPDCPTTEPQGGVTPLEWVVVAVVLAAVAVAVALLLLRRRRPPVEVESAPDAVPEPDATSGAERVDEPA